MNVRISDKDEVLQRLDVGQRLRFILSRLEREVARARVMEDVKRQTEVKIEQHQREFYLRQQLRAIQAELGETDPGEKEAIDTLKKIEDAKLPERAANEARRETERLRMLSPASSEYQVIRNYLDWILSLPWHKRSGDEEIELKKVEELLDNRHYGLQEAKERIVEFLAVRKLRGGRSARAHSLLRRPPRHGQDVVRRRDRQGDRASVLPHRRRWRARRSRDSRTPAHVRRLHAGAHHPGTSSGGSARSGAHDRRGRQDVGRRRVG
jgi:ATP-dependent Lon protease